MKYNAREAASLYVRRWDIELKLRDVKTTLGMERFDMRTPEMASRTLWMMVIACNLLRSLMQRAAIVAGKPVEQMSFKGILDHAVASHESYLAPPPASCGAWSPIKIAWWNPAQRKSSTSGRSGGNHGRSIGGRRHQLLTSHRNTSPRASALGGMAAKLRAIPDSL